MSVMILVDRERDLIDSYRPHTANSSPVVKQADDVGEDLQTIGAPNGSNLPTPSVGGLNASSIRNGFSTGIRSLFNRQQPFSGAVQSAPGVTNSVQGEVGSTGRASRLYAGVMDQRTQYVASQDFATAYVGALPLAAD